MGISIYDYKYQIYISFSPHTFQILFHPIFAINSLQEVLFPYFATFRICTYANIIISFLCSSSFFRLWIYVDFIFISTSSTAYFISFSSSAYCSIACIAYINFIHKKMAILGKWNWGTDFNDFFCVTEGFSWGFLCVFLELIV